MTEPSDVSPEPVGQRSFVPLASLSVGPPVAEPESAEVADEDADEDAAGLLTTFAQRRRGGGGCAT